MDTVYQALPIVLVFFLAYFIAKSFFSLYDMVLRTTVVLYLKAKEDNLPDNELPHELQSGGDLVLTLSRPGKDHGYNPEMEPMNRY